MKKIGIISDTHSYWDEKYLHYFEPCDEIWHAGDIGSLEVAEKLAEFRPLRAVCGNCDGGDLRLMYPEVLRWKCEDVEVLMKHPAVYCRSLAYIKGKVRQDSEPVAHQPRCCRFARLAQGANAHKTDY